jgi:phosphate transport system protein
MEKADLVQHTSRKFNAELEHVLLRALEMARLVEVRFQESVKALVTADSTLAARVVQGDTQINEMEREITAECQLLLATRAPAASDLRMLLAVIKTIGDVERMGDECKKIALVAIGLTQIERARGKFREIRHLARVVQQMVHAALDAFERLDADAAWVVMRMDRAIDTEYEAIQRQCVTYMMEDPEMVRRALDDMWTIRALERVGDHAKNLCEYVIYVVHGKDIRHSRPNVEPQPQLMAST